MVVQMTNLLDVEKLGQGKPDKVRTECHSMSSKENKNKNYF